MIKIMKNRVFFVKFGLFFCSFFCIFLAFLRSLNWPFFANSIRRFLDLIPNILLEDESLECEENKKTNQILLKGLGELHIEVVLTKLRTEHELNITLDKMTVLYKESPTGTVTQRETTDRLIKHMLRFFELEIEIEPMDPDEPQTNEDDRGARKSEVVVALWPAKSKMAKAYRDFCIFEEDGQLKKKGGGALFESSNRPEPVVNEYTFHNKTIDVLYDIRDLKFRQIKLIQDMLQEMTERGPLMSNQLVNARIKIIGGRFNEDYLDDVAIRMTVNNCYLSAIRRLSVSLLEPVCLISVRAPDDALKFIMSEATGKREAKLVTNGDEFEDER